MADVSCGECLFSGTETVPKGQAAAIVCIVTYDAYAQLSVHALRRELRGEPYAGKPHVRFGEGGVSRLAHPYLYGFEEAVPKVLERGKMPEFGRSRKTKTWREAGSRSFS